MAEKKKKAKEPVSKRTSAEPFYKRYLFQIVIAAFVFVLYADSIPNGYNMDDGLVTHHHKYTSLGFSGIPKIISSPYYADEQGYAYDYRPVVHLSFAIENQFFGDNPQVGHFFNVLLYILCCLVLYKLLRNLLPVPDWICLAGVLLFAVHPAHTEVVCSLKNRDELLAMLFIFLSFNLYSRFYETGKWQPFLAGFAMAALSFLSKLSPASYAAFIPVALLLFKGQKPARALIIAVITGLCAVLIQPSVTLGNKVNTLLLLIMPVVLVIAVQNYRGIVLWVKALPSMISSGWHRFAEYRKQRSSERAGRLVKAPAPESVKLNEQSDVREIQSWFLFKDNEPITDWSNWKAYIINLVLLVLGGLAFLFGSLLGTIVMAAVLMVNFLFSKSLHRWLAFIALSVYLVALFAVFPDLGHYFFPYTAMLFIAYSLHPGKHYSIAAGLLFVSFFAISLLLGTESQFNSLEILLGWSLVRTKYGKVIAGIILLLLLGNIVTLFTHGAAFLKDQIYLKLLDRVSFGVLVGAGLYLAYSKIDFSRYIKVVLGLLMLALTTTTLMKHPENGRHLFGRTFGFGMFYYHNAEASLQVAKAVFNAPQAISQTGHQLIDAQKKLQQVQNQVAASKVEVFTVATDRPLLYLEAPVNVTDPLSVRIGTSLVVLLHYAKLAVFPHPLSFYYGYRVIEPTPLSNWKAILGLVLYLSLGLLAVWSLGRHKILSLGLWSYLLGIAPFINFNNLIPGVVGDRYVLFPSLGICIIIMAGIQIYAEKKKLSFPALTPAFKYGLGALLLLLSFKTISRNLDWKSNMTLFRHDLQNVPESAQAHNLLALELMQASIKEENKDTRERMLHEAVDEFKTTLRIYPTFFNATFDLARTYSMADMQDSAVVYYKKGIDLNPTFTISHLNIADIYMKRRSWHEAIPFLKLAVQARPKDYTGYDKLSYSYFVLKDYDSSIQCNKKAMVEMPLNPDPLTNLGRLFVETKQGDSARYYLRMSDRMAPGNPVVQQMLKTLGN